MICPLCERDCPDDLMQKHHLRTRKGDKHQTELVCKACHRAVHALFSNKELEVEESPLATVDGLKAHPNMAVHLKFIRKQDPAAYIKMATCKRVRKRGRR